MSNTDFCYVKALEMGNRYYALSAKGKTWDVGSTLNVYFIGGTRMQTDLVERTIAELSTHANIVFKTTRSQAKSDIRVSFVRNAGSWSYVGTDALYIAKTQATMNFGWLDRAVILHEFMHALGFLHEHQNPQGGIKWNRDAVIRDLSGPPNSWDLRTIEHNVLKMEASHRTEGTTFDDKSIMLYSFPASWTQDGTGTKKNTELSKTDIEHLKKLYPRTNTGPTVKRGGFSKVLRWLGV